MTNEPAAASAAELIETSEAYIAGLLSHGIDTWAKVEQFLAEIGGDDLEGSPEFRALWDMRVGR